GLLWWFSRVAATKLRFKLRVLSRALLFFGLIFFALALLLMVPRFENLGELQPMRSLHPIYVFLFLMIGGFLGECALKGVLWRWLVLFLPLCLGMGYAQRELFPASPHLEWPGRETGNGWVQGFRWIRDHTPADSYFALDPKLMEIPGEDQQGFRAIAERSMLADDVKDGGAVSMFPALAGKWQEQVHAQQGWPTFRPQDFQRLKRAFGVNWVVLRQPGVPGLSCLYENSTLAVCRID
ncbi:MAG TPA: hypothetical protein VLR94_00385, partial [Acidobacteriota bacterium]|nr:hypothetical protein [Acidobacteriota bacterium]